MPHENILCCAFYTVHIYFTDHKQPSTLLLLSLLIMFKLDCFMVFIYKYTKLELLDMMSPSSIIATRMK